MQRASMRGRNNCSAVAVAPPHLFVMHFLAVGLRYVLSLLDIKLESFVQDSICRQQVMGRERVVGEGLAFLRRKMGRIIKSRAGLSRRKCIGFSMGSSLYWF